MTATPSKYLIPYTSEMRREADGGFNECCDASAVMLGAAWTLGEILENGDGTRKNPNVFRNTLRGKAGFSEAGGLTLHDANDMLQAIDPELPPLPRYNGQRLRPGQSSEGANLRLTFEALQERLRDGHVAMLCGDPAGVKDPKSPFRTKARNDRYPHVVVIYRGDGKGATLLDPLTSQGPAWKGERVSWEDVRQFTEAKDAKGDREFGSKDAIACALVPIGAETEAARASRKSLATIARLNQKVADQREQTKLATDERDAARTEAKLATEASSGLRTQLSAAQARIKELEALPTPDCVVQVNAERMRVIDRFVSGFDELAATLR